MNGLPVSIPEASKNAASVDIAFFSVLVISGTIFLILFVLLVAFAARYRKGSSAARGPLPKLLQSEMEIGWTIGTLFLAIFIFWWFVGGSAPPSGRAPGEIEIHIVAKQWMWKAQHPDGAREIDALHIPIRTPIRLVMTSQDVIHSFYVPAFRLKQDVLPVRSTELVFTPTRLGTFRLLCAEFCGTQHSHMMGEIVVMTAASYAAWLASQPHGDTLVSQGAALYTKFGCGACHGENSAVNAPKLDGLYGTTVRLKDGRRAQADEAFLRAAILHPHENEVVGFEPIMPSYETMASTADVEALIAYVKSRASERPSR